MLIDKRKAALMVRILHHLTNRFKEHAILKGGMQFALFSSGRSTNDLDFVFVPYKSKKDIADDIRKALEELPDGPYHVSSSLSSKNAKFEVSKGDVIVEVEVNVASSMESIAANTAVIAKPHGIQPQIIRVMKPEIDLAHKIAAWNERRLLRDLYDIYFWFGVQKVSPDLGVLSERLKTVQSRIPSLRKKKTMSMNELCATLGDQLSKVTQEDIDRELTSVDVSERAGLEAVMKGQVRRLLDVLSRPSQVSS